MHTHAVECGELTLYSLSLSCRGAMHREGSIDLSHVAGQNSMYMVQDT